MGSGFRLRVFGFRVCPDISDADVAPTILRCKAIAGRGSSPQEQSLVSWGGGGVLKGGCRGVEGGLEGGLECGLIKGVLRASERVLGGA